MALSDKRRPLWWFLVDESPGYRAKKITRIDQEQQVLLVTLHDNPGDDIFIGMFEDIGRFQVNNMREFRNEFTVSKFGAS